jgi:hypothetical protein
MKKPFLIIVISCCFITACKTSRNTISYSDPYESPSAPKVIGKVSHQYQITGCSTVIIVDSSARTSNAPHVLIPKDKLPNNLDIEGLEISFNYRILRMPNPLGCNTGTPAEVTHITKSK